jgi:sporulation protein YqfD
MDVVKRILQREKHTMTINNNVFSVLNFFYARFVLCMMAVVAFASFLVLDRLIFSVEIKGVDNEQQSEVRAFLNQNNVRRLTWKSEAVGERASVAVVQHFDFIAHASHKIVGNTLVFNVHTVNNAVPQGGSDIIANMNGIITRMIVVSGTANFNVGDEVRVGDVLIRGEYQVSEETFAPTRAVGEVWADVNYTRTANIHSSAYVMTRTGKQSTKTQVFIGGISGSRAIGNSASGNQDIETKTSNFTLFWNFVVVRTTIHEVSSQRITVDLNVQKEITANELLEQIATLMDGKEFVTTEKIFTQINDDSMLIAVVATVNQAIGTRQEN